MPRSTPHRTSMLGFLLDWSEDWIFSRILSTASASSHLQRLRQVNLVPLDLGMPEENITEQADSQSRISRLSLTSRRMKVYIYRTSNIPAKACLYTGSASSLLPRFCGQQRALGFSHKNQREPVHLQISHVYAISHHAKAPNCDNIPTSMILSSSIKAF